jgi:hypothetical protein
MRFMVLMIPSVYRGNKKLENFAPPPEAIAKMSKFNEELIKAGLMLTGEGLHPLSSGARISYSGGKVTVTDGPFIEAKEVLGGYWILKAQSKEEVVNWMKRCPADPEDIIEIRQVQEFEDFPIEVQKAAKGARS